MTRLPWLTYNGGNNAFEGIYKGVRLEVFRELIDEAFSVPKRVKRIKLVLDEDGTEDDIYVRKVRNAPAYWQLDGTLYYVGTALDKVVPLKEFYLKLMIK